MTRKADSDQEIRRKNESDQAGMDTVEQNFATLAALIRC